MCVSDCYDYSPVDLAPSAREWKDFDRTWNNARGIALGGKLVSETMCKTDAIQAAAECIVALNSYGLTCSQVHWKVQQALDKVSAISAAASANVGADPKAELRARLADTSKGCRNFFRHIRSPQPPPTSVQSIDQPSKT